MSEELSEGVALLLRRMESHPEEFTTGGDKWRHVLGVVEERIFNPTDKRRAEPWMTDEEIRALWGGYQKAKRKNFHDFVMKKLLDDSEEENFPPAGILARGKLAQNTIKPGAMLTVPVAPYTNAISLQGNTTVQGTLDAEPSPAFLEKIKKGLGL
jgi:hypothetical protein